MSFQPPRRARSRSHLHHQQEGYIRSNDTNARTFEQPSIKIHLLHNKHFNTSPDTTTPIDTNLIETIQNRSTTSVLYSTPLSCHKALLHQHLFLRRAYLEDMSDFVPLVAPKGPQGKLRHTRSATAQKPSTTATNLQSSDHLNMNAYRDNSQSSTHQFQPSTPPRTPRKTDQNIAPAKNMGVTAAADGSSKQRSKTKNKSRKPSTSPRISHSERVSPLLNGVSLSTGAKGAKPIPTAAAYAGPTFHASPAPSALPIPSFYSKSVPDSPAPGALQSMKEETSSDSSNSPTPPAPQSMSAQLQHEESPLEIFFKKDRAEKARARGSSSSSGPFQPPDSPHSTHTPLNHDRTRSGHFAGGSGSRMFALELDGNDSPGKPYGPAFSTPYNQRMDAARSVTAPSPSAGRGLEDARDIQTQSQALKDFLFTGQSPRSPVVQNNQSPNTSPYSSTPPNFRSTSTTSSPHNGQPRSAGASSRTYQGHGDFAYINNSNPSILRSSGLRQEVSHTVTPTKTPERNSGYYNSSAPSRVAGNNFSAHSSSHNQNFSAGQPGSPYSTPPPQRGADLQGMEESLRRILKLDSSSGNIGGVGGLGHLPAASASVPNYVGGRAPPMNGVHNGVMGS